MRGNTQTKKSKGAIAKHGIDHSSKARTHGPSTDIIHSGCRAIASTSWLKGIASPTASSYAALGICEPTQEEKLEQQSLELRTVEVCISKV